MTDMFISHIHEEAELAEALKTFFIAAIQLPLYPVTMKRRLPRIFVSSEPEAIPPGEDWLVSIKKELASAKVMIPLLTKRSFNRYWVNFETGAAWMAKKLIFPAWCDEQPPQVTLPRPYADWQIVQLPDRAQDLLKPIEAALGGQTVGLKKNRPPDALRGLQESFKRFHKTEADHASVASLLEKTRSRVPSPQQAKIDWDVFNHGLAPNEQRHLSWP